MAKLSDERIEELAHRMAWRYKFSSDPNHSNTYTFNRNCLLQFVRAIEAEVLASQPAQGGKNVADGSKLWLWKNGDHFLAFAHEYPCYEPGGDPMTLGEPVGHAIFKASHDRATTPAEPPKRATGTYSTR